MTPSFWDRRLWTAQDDGAGMRWSEHGAPGSVASVVGTSGTKDPSGPLDPVFGELLSMAAHVHVLDERGRLWRSTKNIFTGFWEDQGQPGPTVVAAAAVGIFADTGQAGPQSQAFVVGSDGHLWARTADAEDGLWVDHGLPPNRRIRAWLPPIGVGTVSKRPCVPVLADDGQLWLRTPAGTGWEWVSLGAPPGSLIFSLVGACSLATSRGHVPFVAVAVDAGRLWVITPDGPASAWTDLGLPVSGEKVAAGVGAVPTSSPGPEVQIVVVVAPSGNLWTLRWAAQSGAGAWADLGNPTGGRIHASVGLVPSPSGPGSWRAFVIAADKQLWARGLPDPGEPWTRWGLPRGATGLVNGRGVFLFDFIATAAVLAADRRLWMAPPPDMDLFLIGWLAWFWLDPF